MGAGRPRLFKDSLLRLGLVARARRFFPCGLRALSDNDALLSQGFEAHAPPEAAHEHSKAARGASATVVCIGHTHKLITDNIGALVRPEGSPRSPE